jgi:uncharacterized protein
MPTAITIWCVTDEKPGHMSQLQGLTQAIANLHPTETQWLKPGDKAPQQTGKPDLILAAGHRTHLRAIALKWRHGGKLVLLMKPSLPRWLFDLCIIPEHDGVRSSPRVLITKGALNAIRCSEQKDPERGLFLIGGPSKHHAWDDDDVIRQLAQIMTAAPSVQWTLTTSRRTPSTFLAKLSQTRHNNLKAVPVEQTDKDWLLQHYSNCNSIWVSEDSVSMVYESLSSGSRVGVLKVPRKGDSRVSRGLDKLLEENRLLSVDSKDQTQPPKPLREADRAAAYILNNVLHRTH